MAVGEQKREQKVMGVACDATDTESVSRAFKTITSSLGAPTVLVYNAGAFVQGGIMELTADDMQKTWQSNCLGGFICAQAVLPAMLTSHRGTIIFTGATASVKSSAKFTAFCGSKYALRSLSQSIARDVNPQGVHVAHVIIDGIVDLATTRARFPQLKDEQFLDPRDIADSYWNLHSQKQSAWTQEIELRPFVEKW